MFFETFFQNVINSLHLGSFYALIALGYTMVYGVLLLINFAHGDIFMVGAYIGFFISTLLLGRHAGVSLGLPPVVIFCLTVVITMIVTSGVGVAIERIAYRPLRRRGASRLYVVITALMCGLILENGNLALLGASRLSFPQLLPNAVHSIGGVTFTNVKVLVIFTTLIVFVLLETIVHKTRIGMAMRAISYDRMAVPLMGIPIDSIIVFTFALGSSMAALAGVLYATAYPVLDSNMGALVGWKAFIAAVLGGIGEIRGAFVGGFLLGVIEIFVPYFLGIIEAFVPHFFPSTLRDLIAFSILLVFLSVRPTGIFGVARSTKI